MRIITGPMQILAGVLLLAIAMPASAQEPMAVHSAVYVEHRADDAGAPIRRIEPFSRLAQGDRVITILRWDSPPQAGFLATSAIPAHLQLESASRSDVQFSTDRGRSWHKWGDSGGVPAGVTHLRWPLGRLQGAFSYRAVVR